tara:strand:+ start:738 stop:1151 length:414 start_codon:yes stop_codon:yes gene_type:complete
MIQRTQIEQILRLNGLSASSPDEEIKSVLLSARWHSDDIEAAIMVLRENVKDHTTHVDTMHKVFHTDQKLDAQAISSLLGIEMNLTSDQVGTSVKNTRAKLHFNNILVLGLISLLLSLIFVFAAMWYLKMGLFYPLR